MLGVVIAAIEGCHDPDPFLRRAFPAVWGDELDLANAARLAKIADAAGPPGRELVERSGTEAIGAAYEKNRQDAISADVFGSPGGRVFRGNRTASNY
jgi:2-hydroxychromene-2-carboxylate isomerase